MWQLDWNAFTLWGMVFIRQIHSSILFSKLSFHKPTSITRNGITHLRVLRGEMLNSHRRVLGGGQGGSCLVCRQRFVGNTPDSDNKPIMKEVKSSSQCVNGMSSQLSVSMVTAAGGGLDSVNFQRQCRRPNELGRIPNQTEAKKPTKKSAVVKHAGWQWQRIEF